MVLVQIKDLMLSRTPGVSPENGNLSEILLKSMGYKVFGL